MPIAVPPGMRLPQIVAPDLGHGAPGSGPWMDGGAWTPSAPLQDKEDGDGFLV